MKKILFIAALLIAPCYGQFSATNVDDTTTPWRKCWAGGVGAENCSPGGSGSVTSGPTMTAPNASPSVDGSSMQIGFTGTAFTDVLFIYEAGAHNSSTSFVGDYQAYVTATAQDLEFDTYQYLHASLDQFMWGSQCQIGGFWQIWNSLAGTWNNTTVTCTFSLNTWHHIQWYVHRVPGDTSCSAHPCMYYDKLVIDGVVNNINTTYPAGILPGTFADMTGLNFQLDTNSGGGAISESLDQVSLTGYAPGAASYSYVNFSQNAVGAPTQAGIFNSWYGLHESGSDSAFGCTITTANCKIRLNNSTGALTIVSQASSVCGAVPPNSGGTAAKILDYSTTLGSGNSNQDILFNLPASQTGIFQGVTWWCTDIPSNTSAFGTTFDDPILIGVGSQIANFVCNGTACGFGLEGSGQGLITYTSGTWVQIAYQYVNGGTCPLVETNAGNFTNCVRLSEYDATGAQITACIGGGCKFDQYEATGGSGPAFYVTLGNLNPMTLPSGKHVQHMAPKFCYQGCTTDQYPLKEYPVPAADGIIAPGRMTDWTVAGVPGGIPSGTWSQCVTSACNTAFSAGTAVTPAQITTALASAPNNTHVDIVAGTYTGMSGQILFPTTGHVVLRAVGNGADFVGSTGATSCGRSGAAYICAIDAANANPTVAPTLSWTGGYTKGATSTTLSSTAGITTTAGSLPTMLYYNQCDTGLNTGFGCSAGTNTDNSQMFVSDQLYSAPNGCCGNGPGNIIPNRGQMEIHVATSAASGTAVLSTPIISPNILSGQVPAVLPVQSLAYVGLENIRLKNPTGTAAVGISFQNVYAWWIQGAEVADSNSKITWGINCLGCAYGEIQSSYVYNISGNANPYGIRCMMCSFNVEDNNIVQQTGTPFSFDGSSSGNVIAFNYVPNATFSPASNLLQAAFNSHAYNFLDLYDHNVAIQQDQDGIHGTGDMVANFRNGYMGWWSQPATPITTLTNARNDASFDRYMADVFGNYGSSIYHTTYQVSASCSGINAAIFLLGTNCSYGIPGDSLSASTLLRYGNYDTKTAAVRFCGNSLNTGFGTTCGSASESPSSVSTYPSGPPVKGDTSIGQDIAPPSFYYTARPSWYAATVPFPAMGPDVSSGNLLQCGGTINTVGQFAGVPAVSSAKCAGQGTSTLWGGHANAIPAVLCAQSVLGMPADGSGSALAFNAVSCYAGTSSPAVTLSTSSLAFNTTQPIGIRTWPKQVTLTNSGTSTLSISSIAVTTGTQFAMVKNCPSSLTVGASCQMVVTFNPTSAGAKTDAIVITTNATSSPDSVTLTGTGVADNTNVLYGTGLKPIRQLNIFSPPINTSATDYSHLTTVLGLGSALFTGVSPIFPLGCTGTCTGALGTYFDHGTLSPSPTFTGTNGIDTFMATITAASKINNLIVSPASYLNNSDTSQYVGSVAWANTLAVDGVNNDPSLTWQPATAYLTSAYILVGASYWQMQATCSNTDTHDLRCTSGSTIPSFSASPQADGTATWMLIGANAPPQDYWCDSNTTGTTQVNCHQLVLVGAAQITGCPTTCLGQVTVTNPPTFTIGQRITVANAAGGVSGATPITDYNCSTSPCTVASYTATQVVYNMPSGGTNRSDTLSSTGNACTAVSSPQGCISGSHALNINTTNATVAILQSQLPIPYEQPVTVWRNYLLSQLAAHYGATGNPALGYLRPGCTKSGECNEDGIAGWPFGSADQYNSYIKAFSAFLATQGCGSVLTCQLNLNTSPTIQAAYMNTNNLGMDNNALGTTQVSQMLSAAGCPAPGVLLRGGDWCTMFSTYFTLPNGKKSLNTLQTSQQSTPGNCAVTSPAQTTGGLAADLTCVTSPFTAGWPGLLPTAAQFLSNNAEIYFCDILGTLDSGYSSSTCNPQWVQATYQAKYQAAFATFLNWQHKIGSGSGSGQFKFK